jgi:hypothetical protein
MKGMDSLWTFEMMTLYVCKQKMKNVDSKKYHSNVKIKIKKSHHKINNLIIKYVKIISI